MNVVVALDNCVLARETLFLSLVCWNNVDVVETSKSSNLVREKSGNIIIFIPQSVLACLTEYNYTYHSCYTGDPALYHGEVQVLFIIQE